MLGDQLQNVVVVVVIFFPLIFHSVFFTLKFNFVLVKHKRFENTKISCKVHRYTQGYFTSWMDFTVFPFVFLSHFLCLI